MADLSQLKQKVDSVISWMLALLMASMVLNVLWQVFSRYVLSSPSSFSDELARFLLIWLGTLGAAYVAGLDKHLAIDLLVNSLVGRSKVRLQQSIHAIIGLFGLFAMGFGGVNLVLLSHKLGQVSPALGLPLSVVYIVIPISGLLIVFYSIVSLLNTKAAVN
ncbi:TRAP transporter small permease [bacterium]|nr:MAG: TRAP transporter small permease [bacterium]